MRSLLPCIASRLFNGVICRENDDSIYLTFDDGPDDNSTPFFLETLNRFDVKATFFVNGGNAEENIDLLGSLHENGHTIATHGYAHRSLLWKSSRYVYNDLSKSIAVISDVTKCSPVLFRPPYGRIGPAALSAAKGLNLKIVLWSVSSQDWTGIAGEKIAGNVLGDIRKGDIALMHDRGKFWRNTLKAVEILVPELLNRGFSIAPLFPNTVCAAS